LEENKSYPEPFGFHLYMLYCMGLEIIQDDNIVNCINYYDSLFSGGRELEKGKNETLSPEGRGFHTKLFGRLYFSHLTPLPPILGKGGKVITLQSSLVAVTH
jgi:hypothetical protein